MSAKSAGLFAAGWMCCIIPVQAHHSFSAEFDRNKPIELTGTVTKFEWLNPHAHLYIDVKDRSDKVTPVEIQLASPNSLRLAGWSRGSAQLQKGEVVVVSGFRSKDGSNVVNAQWVTLSGGKRMSGVSSIDDPYKR